METYSFPLWYVCMCAHIDLASQDSQPLAAFSSNWLPLVAPDFLGTSYVFLNFKSQSQLSAI